MGKHRDRDSIKYLKQENMASIVFVTNGSSGGITVKYRLDDPARRVVREVENVGVSPNTPLSAVTSQKQCSICI